MVKNVTIQENNVVNPSKIYVSNVFDDVMQLCFANEDDLRTMLDALSKVTSMTAWEKE